MAYKQIYKCAECGKWKVEDDMDMLEGEWICRECEDEQWRNEDGS